jgi:type I restriction-modification system DNA methylase subunit
MTDELIGQIQTFTLAARASLEAEAGQQLEGIYGWLPDGTFGPTTSYPAITKISEAGETRQRLEQFAEDEKVAGLDAKSARRKLVRETAFTWLNRFAAFRLMEERRLLKQTIVRLAQSNGFIFWLTDEKTPQGQQSYALYQQGALPVNAMGEGPNDVAYRRFLLWQCGELAREVSVLFDPDTLASRLCPRPLLLKQLVADMNAEALLDAWKAGNEETIGWIYEGFIEQENKDVFEKFGKGKKVIAEEIGAATQRFTPRWIVKFLVENSLGRLWLEMHPDSRLADKLAYLVPMEKPVARPLKPVSEISFLDPCAGSMHFGFVAFDLFVEMYREELEHAGQSGWPAKASVANADEIATSIAGNNLFGIDIDARAVQIAGLALLIKTRTLQPKARVSDLNLACANVEQISGGKLDAFITQAKFTHPIYERILRSLSARMKNSDQIGSLLRLEKFLEQLIAEERRKVEGGKQFELSFRGLDADQFKTQAGIEEFFGILSEQVLQHLDEFVRSSRAAGRDPGHFVSEAAKGLRYLRLVARHHDVVATNPPYMSRRNMSAVMAQHLDEEYSEAKGDLYAAFIARCIELAGTLGKVAMVTQQSFMFISSYEGLRKKLRSAVAIETMAHLGPRAFPNITGEKVNTIAFVFRREQDALRREEQLGVYFRLVKEPSADSKRCGFESTLAALRTDTPHLFLFRAYQKDFNAIPSKPWVYWMPAGIRQLFLDCRLLEAKAKPRQGLATADNTRFLRYGWEVGQRLIGFGCQDRKSAASTKKRWFPYNKGGAAVPWHRRQDNVVDWARDGAAIRCFGEEEGYIRSRPQNTDYYFQKGVTWSDISTKGFAARFSPFGFIHDVKGMTCFPGEADVLQVLGLLNSRLSRFILSALNPTVSFQVGDIERLPLPSQRSQKIDNLVEQCVELAKRDSLESELSFDFESPPHCLEGRTERKNTLSELEVEIDTEVSRLYGLSEPDLAAIDHELSISTAAEEIDNESSEGVTEDDEDKTNFTPADLAESWISYAIGAVLGRFQIGVPGGLGCGAFPSNIIAEICKLVDSDGILVSDKSQSQDIVKRTLGCLVLMLGGDAARATTRTAAGDDGDPEESLRVWIDRQFWKYHYQLYRKRPVYWPLQSPKKRFTVWVFHEHFSNDTLFRIKDQFVQVKINWLNGRIKDLRPRTLSGDIRERRAAEKEISQLSDVLDDVQEFAERLKRITERGYTPHIDDGVLLNAAPLWELLPAWKDAEKAWEELEAGDYDWAQQAMEYWPDRVRKACQTNKSFAIAHGLA